MGTRIANYDSESVALIICAIPILDGKADEFVTVDKDDESYGEEMGADGSVCRFATHSSLYTVTVKLKGFSSEHQKLMALHALDTNSSNGSGIGVFFLKDSSGATLMGSDKCWIKKPPAGGFGKTRPDGEWIVKVVATPAQMLIGGN